MTWAHTWYSGEVLTAPEPPMFVCKFCYRNLRYDGIELCEVTQSMVHQDCHEDECMSTLCSTVLCTVERCDTLEPCDWCGGESCARHRPHAHDSCKVDA